MKNLLLILALCLYSITSHATTYYVSTTGNDANPGTITLPFRNLQKLNTVMSAGDIAYIRGGTYQSTFGTGNGYHLNYDNLVGTWTNPIVIQNYPGETVIMDFSSIGAPTTCYPYAVLISNCEFPVLDF